MSLDDARAKAGILRVEYSEIAIKPMFDAFSAGARRRVHGTSPDAAEENFRRAFAAPC